MDTQLIEYLRQFVTEERWEKFEEIINYRTKHLTFVVENIFQSHNASAVIRSCDCFGIQDLHVIETKNKYVQDKKIALGAGKWVNMYSHNDFENGTVKCLNHLKSKGYKIVATTPHKDDFTCDTLPIDEPIAVVFGTEKLGITQDVADNADYFMKIPMLGFTESLNISVAAAITAQNLSRRIIQSEVDWKLSETEKNETLYQWLTSSIKSSDLIVDKYHKEIAATNPPKN